MAGFYVDVPGFRFEYDRDGSIMVGSSTTLSLADTQVMNDESSASETSIGFFSGTSVGVAWPEVRDVTGFFADIHHGVSDGPYTVTLYKSADTTNVMDGTWTSAGSVLVEINSDIPVRCRTTINPLSLTAIKGVRYDVPGPLNGTRHAAFHVYGQIPLTENPDRLILCDTAGTVVTDGAYFDFGNSPRATTATKTFRVGNNSSTLTANSIAMSFQTLYDASPTLAGQFQYDFGAGWVTTGNIGNLGPGAVSNVIQVRRNTLATAAGGPWQSRVVAVPASMT